MKIAVVCQPWDEIVTPIDRSSSSVAIIAYRMARGLVQAHEVVLYAPRGAGQAAVESLDDGIVVRRVAGSARRLVQLADRAAGIVAPGRPLFASRLHSVGYWRQVGRSLAREGFDAAHTFSFAQHARTLRSFDPNLRVTMHMQGESLAQLGRESVERQLEDVAMVVGCSEFITDQVRRRFPEMADRCHTIYNGVDLERFAPRERGGDAPGSERLLFVGRVSPEKGVHVLVDAFERLLERFPGARLDLVGAAGSLIALPYAYHVGISRDPLVRRLGRFYGGSLIEKARRQLMPGGPSYFADLQRRLAGELADRVRFRAQLPHGELLECYRSADLFVFPSVWEEPFGMPIVEAMACGVPVVATRGGGIPEIVAEGETGLLVERGDAVALAEAMARMLEDRALARRMGAAGRRRVEARFGWDRVGADLAELYDRPDRLPAKPERGKDAESR